jgi:hypothetical protein
MRAPCARKRGRACARQILSRQNALPLRLAGFDIRVPSEVVEFCIAQMAQGQEPAQASEVGESAFADHGESLA